MNKAKEILTGLGFVAAEGFGFEDDDSSTYSVYNQEGMLISSNGKHNMKYSLTIHIYIGRKGSTLPMQAKVYLRGDRTARFYFSINVEQEDGSPCKGLNEVSLLCHKLSFDVFSGIHFGYHQGSVLMNCSFMTVDDTAVDVDKVCGAAIPQFYSIFEMVENTVRRVASGEITADGALDVLMD